MPNQGVEGRVYYFGCWQDLGHYWWTPGSGKAKGRAPLKIGIQPPTNQPWGHVDGKLAPRGHVQSVAAVHHREGWTAIAMEDRTVDARPASQAVFLLRGLFDFAQAMDAIRDDFPEVVERIERVAPIVVFSA